MDLDMLMAHVTGAIIRAETALDHAIDAWVTVEKAETEIMLSPTASDADRLTAARGVGMARERVALLRALQGDRP